MEQGRKRNEEPIITPAWAVTIHDTIAEAVLVSLAIRNGVDPLHHWKELYYCGWLSFSA
jgi:hypothetical protein